MSQFNPQNQYRCTIIRGKSISRMDDFLPIYAEILAEICPLPADVFPELFDKRLSEYLKADIKTVKNHRTENVSSILGMCYEKDQTIFISKRTLLFLNNNDQPAFFKSLCYKFQQPNGSQKFQTIERNIKNGISIKPYHYIISLLAKGGENDVIFTRNEIAYYVLNSLEVLQGKVDVQSVFDKIITDRNNSVINKVEDSDKAFSYNMQHINEQFDYLEFANLIRKNKTYIWLNLDEEKTIEEFINDLDSPLYFDIYRYDLTQKGVSKKIALEWQEYFSDIDEAIFDNFTTSVKSLEVKRPGQKPTTKGEMSTVELGDEGEDFVFNYEKELVKSFNVRLVNKVNHLGRIKGLGYDISSIQASRDLKNPEFSRLIEVKTTKRVNPPKFENTPDSISMTRNEWVAAQQNQNHYYIYRVYFTSQGTFINIIENPVEKNEKGMIYAVPTQYRVEINEPGFDQKLEFPQKGQTN